MHSLNRIRPACAFTCSLHGCLTWRRSSTQLFVGGLSYDTNESVLKDAFEECGEITEVKVICDRVSGKSRGYGFVCYSSEVAAASKALKEMDGRLLDGRNIRIHYAHRGKNAMESEPKSWLVLLNAVLRNYENLVLVFRRITYSVTRTEMEYYVIAHHTLINSVRIWDCMHGNTCPRWCL